ncbi:magnesium protoporphyrin IX methyltransferase [Pararhodospirillum oryzae]|uniref:Magnesium protoporphyrin IX methyltransferase n=1 Tax=Pararhodospirillum oryzae TaxID=478448 RepID=A0A512H4Y0_9PROT|nr:magnesium protoporphyrin IX methyltransferase [Pararhodospirillum oryzae]GEO80522.1 magnesium protoporphyrin IX methyltransferase [Pararhodospirillum oryzae]
MTTGSYDARRGQIQTYFDRTASEAWKRLTSDAPLGRIRATVRAGRDAMRATLLSWLPADLTGKRLLDAGCGTGLLSFEAAARGATVVAIDVAPTLIEHAKTRAAELPGPGSIDFQVGDMLDPALGRFDYVVAMDSLIHYEMDDTLKVLAGLVARTDGALVITFAPRTPLLALMHFVGQFFPRTDRSPAIVPLEEKAFFERLSSDPAFTGWRVGRTVRIVKGFYISQALELCPA